MMTRLLQAPLLIPKLWNGQIVKLPNAFFLPNRFDLQPINNKGGDNLDQNYSGIAWEINRNNYKVVGIL